MRCLAATFVLAALLSCVQAFDWREFSSKAQSNHLMLPFKKSSIDKLKVQIDFKFRGGDELAKSKETLLAAGGHISLPSNASTSLALVAVHRPAVEVEEMSSTVAEEDGPKTLFDIVPSACGAVLFGWEMHDDRLPQGTWHPYEAKSAAACTAACASRPRDCVAAMWTDTTFPLPAAYAGNSKCELVSALTGMARSDIPDGIDFYTPCNTGCDAEVEGYQKYPGTLPRGSWKKYAADTPADCAAACTAHDDKCIAAVWEDALILPYGEPSRCQLVDKLTGYTRDMPQGVHLYAKC